MNMVDAKVPPQNRDIEKAVLGALLLDRDAITEVSHILSAADFYVEAHQLIYDAVQSLYMASEVIDLLTVTAQLISQSQLDAVGGQIYLIHLSNEVGSTAHIGSHAYLLKALSVKRQLILYSTRLGMVCYDEETDFDEAMSMAMTGLDQISTGITRLTERSYSRLVYDTVAEMREAAASEYTQGTLLYLTDIDRVTLGFQNSDLVIADARPGMGKTAFIIQAAKRQAEAGIPVGIFSLEMSARQNIQRIIAQEIQTDIRTIRRGGLHREQWQALDERIAHLASLPVQICDQGGMTINDIVATAKKWKLKHGIRILYVDYLQLVTVDRGSKGMNREQEISTISRRLKQLAKELDIPVVALSQLSRNVESRADKRPMLSDLRESGAIEQDADLVMFLYRPEYYHITQDDNYGNTQHVCEVIIAKYRNGEPCTILTEFHAQHFRFGNRM